MITLSQSEASVESLHSALGFISGSGHRQWWAISYLIQKRSHVNGAYRVPGAWSQPPIPKTIWELSCVHYAQYDTVHRGGVSLLWSGLDQIWHQKAGLPASALCIWIKFYVYDYRFLSCWGSIKFPISPFFPITSWQDLATGDQSEASIRVTWSLSNNQRLVLVETVCPRHMGLKNYLKTISFSSLIVKIAAITTK